MAITAENLATEYNISRQECDEFALLSQQRWVQANANGHFKDEIAPVEVKGRKGLETFEVDEHPRGEKANIAELTKLKAVFKKDGTVTAGNASGICDGAGTIILADEATVKEHALKPLAKVAGYHVSGCDPKIMGIGPVPAIQGLLQKTGLTIDHIDVCEVSFFEKKLLIGLCFIVSVFIRSMKLLLHSFWPVEKHWAWILKKLMLMVVPLLWDTLSLHLVHVSQLIWSMS